MPVVLAPGLLAAPVLVSPAVAVTAAAARPVAPHVVELPLTGVEPAAAATAPLRTTSTGTEIVLTGQRSTASFGVVGVTWEPTPVAPALEVAVRTRSRGAWSPWTDLAVDPEVASAGGTGARPGTDPVWVGAADGVQARVRLLRGPAPDGLRLALVDPGTSAADAHAASPAVPARTASAALAAPDVRPRSAWGADESLRGGSPSYAARVRAVTLHHTASSSAYAQDEVPALLRGFYAYHVTSNGWSDIGYNFLVDRFGTVWEGRYGGIARPVVGAHAGGFNTGTVGISMIGTYETDRPSAAMLESVARVAGWKLGAAGVDPRGHVTLTSAGSTRWAGGTAVTVPTIFPHRAVSTTSCPGEQGMAALPGLRERAAALAAGAAPQRPVEERDDTLRVEAPSSVASGDPADVVVRGVPGQTVQLWFAGADPSAGASLRREGTLDADGAYRTSFTAETTQVLFAVAGGRTSARVRTTVGTAPPARATTPSALAIAGPVTAAPGTAALVTVTGPAGTRVSVWFRPREEQAFMRRREGTLGPDGTYTTSYVAAEPLEYFAMSSTVTSDDAGTDLGPVPNGLHVTTPSAGVAGAEVPVVVQGAPGLPVELWFSRDGAPFTRRREGVLAPDGTYRTTWTSTQAHTVYAVAGGRTSTRVSTAMPGSVSHTPASTTDAPALVTTVPARVDAGSTVEVTVTGRPGTTIALWFRPRSEEVFTRRRTGVVADDGTFRSSYVGADDQQVYATAGGLASPDASALVAPVLAAPVAATLGPIVLTGRARPGDAVVIEQRTGAAGALRRLSATADSRGAYRLQAALGDASTFRAVAAGRTSAPVTTQVRPLLVVPPTSGRGNPVRLSGTARPGAVVEVLVRARGASAFVVARRLRADAEGRFASTATLGVSHRLYARADGLASGQRIVTVR